METGLVSFCTTTTRSAGFWAELRATQQNRQQQTIQLTSHPRIFCSSYSLFTENERTFSPSFRVLLCDETGIRRNHPGAPCAERRSGGPGRTDTEDGATAICLGVCRTAASGRCSGCGRRCDLSYLSARGRPTTARACACLDAPHRSERSAAAAATAAGGDGRNPGGGDALRDLRDRAIAAAPRRGARPETAPLRAGPHTRLVLSGRPLHRRDRTPYQATGGDHQTLATRRAPAA